MMSSASVPPIWRKTSKSLIRREILMNFSMLVMYKKVRIGITFLDLEKEEAVDYEKIKKYGLRD